MIYKDMKSTSVVCKVKIPIVLDNDINKNAIFYGFDNFSDGKEHIAIAFGNIEGKDNILVRIHSECLTGDVFNSQCCDCGPQLRESLRILSNYGGILLYLRQEGRGIGLLNKLRSYELQQQGMDTYAANNKLGFPDDLRDYQPAAEMLKILNINSIRLLTNNPDKVTQIKKYGIKVTEVKNTGCHLNENNVSYLKAKKEHTYHNITINGLGEM
ncbi:GTP cyclohydrolase II [Xenorhabdus griffiniae]|uniref:GTP cyclohydrolase II n=1 Tax=Xenorhabdus griffiniae TaxID=351672 RepID=UPI002359A2FF|nr:GTP cyclohydrolase II [Xenorhabdus griffiniae]MDC9606768.1 GTP cyclohydrolase II [Xenorhabdus griffiniae]